MKITFMGAGSTIFARNVIGDCMCVPELKDSVFALYDIDGARLQESRVILEAIKNTVGCKAVIECYLGPENRKAALCGATFVVNAIQVGGYDPCTIIDFEVPKKYGLQHTIGDTLGIGGIMRALRTIPVMQDFANDMQEVCPSAWLLNYTNPMAMLTGYMQRYTGVKTVGLCHSVQVCAENLFNTLGMDKKLLEGRKELIAGINHMAWLLELRDKDNNDLYPQVKERIEERLADPNCRDKVRLDYIKHFGYYCTESSEHNAEYNMFYIKNRYPELIQKYNIPIDEYPRRCVNQINGWKKEYEQLMQNGVKQPVRSLEYASHIMQAIVTGEAYKIGGNVLNNGLITNLPAEACVEVPCLVDSQGVHGCYVGALPVQCAAMNMTNINVQLLTIEAAKTLKKEHIYQAAMLDPHTASELDIDTIKKMVDELIEKHGDYLPVYH
ncbi:MAG: alpha-glucosidase/alpha-galactosidase [Clostridia bacterium]|nr:alpha-glucosidase/alpha-galactosidase [Clostridia bacterium]